MSFVAIVLSQTAVCCNFFGSFFFYKVGILFIFSFFFLLGICNVLLSLKFEVKWCNCDSGDVSARGEQIESN